MFPELSPFKLYIKFENMTILLSLLKLFSQSYYGSTVMVICGCTYEKNFFVEI